MSTELQYTNAVRRLLDHLDATQPAHLERAAEAVVGALTTGGAVFCSEIGHGVHGDFLNRAGGLAAVQPFSFAFSVSDPVADRLVGRPHDDAPNREIEAIRLAVRTSNLRRGDVMVAGSVSGKNVRPIELTLACREVGITTIAITSFAYTERVTSLHPSGLRLRDAADIALDCGAPYGDAAVRVDGIDIDVCPLSGVGATVVGWMLWERVMARLAAAGTPPAVFMSVNREGGQEHYQASRALYNERGY